MVVEELRTMRITYNCDVYVYCLMPDHLHFLTKPRIQGASILTFQDRFKGKTTNLSWKLDWEGKLWQHRSYDHGLRREENFNDVAEYILQNPVRQNLVKSVEDWSWSGIIDEWM